MAVLLIVLPGRSGREPILRRIIEEVSPVAVLVPSKLAEYSAWARPLVRDWIEFTSPDDSSPDRQGEYAWSALSAWKAETQRVVAGCTTWDEWGIELCAYLCESKRLQLPYTPLDTVRQLRNKTEFRRACMEAGAPAPRFANVQNEAQLRSVLQTMPWQYPLIIKPSKGSGSYYVCKVETESELLAAFPNMDQALRHHGKTPQEDAIAGWCLEEFFAGAEVDVDGWAKDGEIEWMVVSDNKPCLVPSCCETGGVYPSQLPPALQQKLEQLTRKVVGALPGIHSAFHFEALVNTKTEEVMPVELNLRVGGAECPCSVEAVTGIFLPTSAANLALNGPTCPPQAAKANVVSSTNEYFEHCGLIEACEGSEELFADPDLIGAAFFGTKGAQYVPGMGSSSCLCWLAAGGQDAEAAERNLQRCISKCRLALRPENSAYDEIA